MHRIPKRLAIHSRALAVCALLGACASEESYSHRFSAGLGQRDIGGDFEPADRQLALAVEYSVRKEQLPLGAEFGFTYSTDDADTSGGVSIDTTVQEIYAGLRYTWGLTPNTMPYISGGLAFLDAEAEAQGFAVSDEDFAPYVGAGLDFGLDKNWFLGAGFRYVFNSGGDFLGIDGDADGPVVLLRLSYSF